jgi:hypothetical protein
MSTSLLPPLRPAELHAASIAWRDRGCLSLSLWLSRRMQRDGRRTFSVAQYAELVERVREHLGDTTDYSQEEV